MRIIAGRWRGRTLIAPPGQATRPTSDRAREAIFSMLTSRIGTFDGLKIVDLFAGTGALGLEALSRGAAHCVFVENAMSAATVLRQNIEKLGASATVEVRNAERFSGGPFDLAFADAPYGSGLGAKALAQMNIDPGGWAVLETARDEAGSIAGFETTIERLYGKAKVTLFRKT
jgi:16S rRNA (guanine966-N2)-methyltransferase